MLSLMHGDILKNVWMFSNPKDPLEWVEIPAWSVECVEIRKAKWADYERVRVLAGKDGIKRFAW